MTDNAEDETRVRDILEVPVPEAPKRIQSFAASHGQEPAFISRFSFVLLFSLRAITTWHKASLRRIAELLGNLDVRVAYHSGL